MKKIVIVVTVLTFNLCWAVEPYQEFMSKLVELQQWIDSSIGAAPIGPCLDCTPETNPLCDYNSLCEHLSKNKNSREIYHSEDGNIPNFRMIALTNSYLQCHATFGQQGIPQSVRQSTLQNKKEIFLQSIPKNNDQEAWEKIMESARELALSPEERLESEESKLNRFEEHAGVKLSAPTRAAYLNYMNALHEPATTLDQFNDAWAKTMELIQNQPLQYLTPITQMAVAGSTENLQKYQQTYQDAANRAESIFKETQNTLIELLQKRQTPENQNQIDEMIHRIETVSLQFQELPTGAQGNACPGPNAFYNSGDHSILLCPQILEFPGTSLTSIIAHELGHSIDPCFITGELKEFNIPLNPQQETQNQNYKQWQQTLGNYFFQPSIASTRSRDHVLINDILGTVNEQYITTMLAGRKLSQAHGIASTKNPFSSVIDCLHSKDSVEAARPNQAQTLADIDQAISELEAQGASIQNNPLLAQLYQTKQNLPTLMANKGGCSFIPTSGNSEIQEAFADWVSSQVIAQKLSSENNPQRRARMAKESTIHLLGMTCPNVYPQLPEEMRNILSQCTSMLDNSMSKDIGALTALEGIQEGAYPWDADRINRIMMANPIICNALGCTNQVTYCE